MDLRDKHIFITGGARGIGWALSQALHGAGAKVSLCGRNDDALRHAAETLGDRTATHRCDLSDATQHAGLLDAVTAANGPLDVLIHNAGVQQRMDFRDTEQTKTIASEVALNLTAPLLLTELALPTLLSRPEAAVVTVTSGLALSPKASAPVYCATKAGLRAFTRGLRWQLRDTNVRVVEVLPPLVDTAMTAGRGRGKLEPRHVAQDTVRALRGRAAEVWVGKSKLLRAIHGLSPRLAWRITRDM